MEGFRLVLGSVLGVLLAVGSASAPVPRTMPRVGAAPAPGAAVPTFSRRPPAGDEDSEGEFVHAIQRGRAERPLDIVQA